MHGNYGVLQSGILPIKRDILYFDKIMMLETPQFSRYYHLSNDEIRANLAYLKSAKLLEEQILSYGDIEDRAKASGLDTETFTKQVNWLRSQERSEIKWTGDRLPPLDSPLPGMYERDHQINTAQWISGYKARLFAIVQTTEEKTFTPILSPDSLQSPTDSKKSDIIELILNEFPTPDEGTPYEEILAFKAEASVQRDFELFRRWMRKKVRDENASLLEVREEISDLISDYREHMELAKMKYHHGVVRTVLTAPLGLVEKVVKLQLSKIFDAFFDLRASKIGLAEAEIKAPGREVAYIEKATQRFSST